MKKLLIRLFPSFFNIHIEKIIDINTYPEVGDKLTLIEVDPGNQYTHESLGIEEARLKFLITEVRKSVLDSDNTIEAMKKMEVHIRHVNEFYMVTIVLQKELEKMNNPLNGLLGALMKGQEGGKE